MNINPLWGQTNGQLLDNETLVANKRSKTQTGTDQLIDTFRIDEVSKTEFQDKIDENNHVLSRTEQKFCDKFADNELWKVRKQHSSQSRDLNQPPNGDEARLKIKLQLTETLLAVQ